MRTSDGSKIKKPVFFSIIWTIILLVILSGATFAWFSFTSYTNVSPMRGSVGNGGADLKISNSESGPFSNETELIVNGKIENLQPVSTFDLNEWFTAVSHNSQGITTKFENVTYKINDQTMYGTVFLQSNGGDCDVYFNSEQLKFEGDAQLLASSRLGIEITTSEGNQKYIFDLGSYADSTYEERMTTENYKSVVISVDSNGTASYQEDPSVEVSTYSTVPENSEQILASRLVHAPQDEIIRVDWRLYMEGCDENCLNSSQNKGITMNLAFTGIGTK